MSWRGEAEIPGNVHTQLALEGAFGDISDGLTCEGVSGSRGRDTWNIEGEEGLSRPTGRL
jgi:hypothetical protein